MTTQEIQNYYSNLLSIEYIGKARAYAMINAFSLPFIMDQLPVAVQNAYCLGNTVIAGTEYPSAVGTQLDIIGKYAGVTRTGSGITGNPITLGDSDFISLITMAIIVNTSGSSLATIQNLLHTYFPSQIFVYDFANMQMSYLVTAAAGSISLVELFVTEKLLPKPMGVELSSIVYVPSVSLFGFETYQVTIPAWDSTVSYNFGNEVLSNGIVYQSLVNNNLNNAVTNPEFWVAIIYPFNSYVTYPTYEPYTWLSYADTLVIV